MNFNKQHGLFLKAILKYSFVFLFSLFFLWGQASTISNSSEDSETLSNQSLSQTHNPFDLPSDVPIVPATEENESFDDDDDWNDVYYFVNTQSCLALELADNVVECSNEVSNQIAERPLFMLYHCWKSFLI